MSHPFFSRPHRESYRKIGFAPPCYYVLFRHFSFYVGIKPFLSEKKSNMADRIDPLNLLGKNNNAKRLPRTNNKLSIEYILVIRK